jgi:hypothetical protein
VRVGELSAFCRQHVAEIGEYPPTKFPLCYSN